MPSFGLDATLRPAMPRFPVAALLPLLAIAPLSAHADTLKVLTTGAFKQVVVALVPAFEARTGHKVDVQNDTAGALAKRVAAGEAFDVIVLTPAGLRTLASEAKVVPESVVALARVGIGVAVKEGAPRPPVATADEFKAAVLGARKVAYIDPAAGGSSGIYLDGLFQKMGIAEAVRAKAVLVPGGLVAERLVSGEADLAIHQISEILPVKGAVLVAPLPEAIQNYTTYAGAVSPRAANAEAARAFLATLAGDEAKDVLRAKGMMPAR
ncbi:MAG: substrate-binding domain-containing protein [Betaproteobacteria bacterium]|jgi:molybdate transport system substrate-binding protein|nr:substrate-binding domain-containing protein [Betaproteobacteria bacterium]